MDTNKRIRLNIVVADTDTKRLMTRASEELNMIANALTHEDAVKYCADFQFSDEHTEVWIVDEPLYSLSQLPISTRAGLILLTGEYRNSNACAALITAADDYLCHSTPATIVAAKALAVARRLLSSRHKELHTGQFNGESSNRPKLSLRPTLSGDPVLPPMPAHIARKISQLDLTGTEYALLSILARQPDTIVTKEQLYTHGLQRPYYPSGRSIDVHISRIRQKLFQARMGTIKSIRNRGYLYQADNTTFI